MAHLKCMGFFGVCLFTLVLMTWYNYKYKKIQYTQEHTEVQEEDGAVHTIPYTDKTVQYIQEYTDPMYFYKQEAVYKQNFLFTLREHLNCSNETFLVILVTSRPTDRKARQAIRQSWGSQNSWWGKEVLTLFLLGQTNKGTNSIKKESILYGDIIQQNYRDTYENLTLKTIMAFRWVTEFCSSARFVMKTDSDVFINTGNLVKYLINSNATENFITGYPFVDTRCFRGIFSKNYVSYEDYPFEIFPPYLSGTGYVLDGRLAHRIYVMMAHVKPVKFEDVYIGICLSILKVGISYPKDLGLFFIEKLSFDICRFKHLIVAHKTTPEEMIEFWDKITRDSSLSCH